MNNKETAAEKTLFWDHYNYNNTIPLKNMVAHINSYMMMRTCTIITAILISLF